MILLCFSCVLRSLPNALSSQRSRQCPTTLSFADLGYKCQRLRRHVSKFSEKTLFWTYLAVDHPVLGSDDKTMQNEKNVFPCTTKQSQSNGNLFIRCLNEDRCMSFTHLYTRGGYCWFYDRPFRMQTDWQGQVENKKFYMKDCNGMFNTSSTAVRDTCAAVCSASPCMGIHDWSDFGTISPRCDTACAFRSWIWCCAASPSKLNEPDILKNPSKAWAYPRTSSICAVQVGLGPAKASQAGW